jgi:hypothetical protein
MGGLSTVCREPESLDARCKCGLALLEEGDTRGELILLAIIGSADVVQLACPREL